MIRILCRLERTILRIDSGGCIPASLSESLGNTLAVVHSGVATESMASCQGWQLGKSILQCNKYMLENKVCCDVKFVFTQVKPACVTAHKFMLISRSPVFYEMFKETKMGGNEAIEITDICPEIFQEMLR